MLLPYPHLTVGALLLALPLRSFAQEPTAAPAPAGRFYVGLAAFHSNYQNVWVWQPNYTGFRVPVQLTAGYQLRPRLALELGVAYRGFTSDYDIDEYYTHSVTGMLTHYQYHSAATNRTATVTALARYALKRQPTQRFQVDVLGGATLVRSSHSSHGYQTNLAAGPDQTIPFSNRVASNYLLLTAGLGLRYHLTPRLTLNFDVATNRNVTFPAYYGNFTGSSALGVRYRLGQP
ncbi:outer membrane beta-barrel protein [Hymenobacter sp. M29]|uniref:Outer membrane beta-barrel protein n=1 Tax=Hymenobacter mellowenesis TaxID=3063995 RepID=A0ABT9AGK5_9BACT|nr:outer membrane beta-barrel protein [Hymenobacter sp. M29]MDO7848091.1 outer membrane beta-barrel protein [Hymenobacter sp. M29]